MDKGFVGIDPGDKGFFTLIYPTGIQYYQIPLIKKKVDYTELAKIVEDLFWTYGDNIHVVLEDVHAIFGAAAKSTFNFGHIAGFLEGLVNAYKMPYTKVAPKKWQKEMFEGIPVQQKPSSTGKTMVNDTKAMALMAAKRLFPKENLLATARSSKPHDGKVDSLLMAEYCRRNFK
jgi:hypothetical protein